MADKWIMDYMHRAAKYGIHVILMEEIYTRSSDFICIRPTRILAFGPQRLAKGSQ